MTEQKKSLLVSMADKFSMETHQFANTIKATCLPKDATDEQFAAFLMVAKEHDLNPLTKEIYAFPSKGGGIQPIVGVDGWAKIMNSHPQFDGLEFQFDHDDKSHLAAVTARIHRKDREHPIVVTEYMSECKGATEPWKKWPARMLRHKAMIQCCRIAFGFTNILDPDEWERHHAADIIDVTSTPVVDLNEQIKAAATE
jgi:phage recombination protein Bet